MSKPRSYTLTLPWPPYSLNHMYRAGQGNYYKVPEAKEYSETVYLLALQKYGPPEQIDGDLKVTIRQYLPDRRKRDIDGVLKLVLDSVAHALGFDDSQVTILHTQKWYRPERKGELEVEVLCSSGAMEEILR